MPNSENLENGSTYIGLNEQAILAEWIQESTELAERQASEQIKDTQTAARTQLDRINNA